MARELVDRPTEAERIALLHQRATRGPSPRHTPRMPVTDAPIALDYSEVKGLWFVSARRYALERHGAEALAEVIATMKPRWRAALESPLASAWYAEEAMRDAFAAASTVLAQGNEARIIEMFEGCALYGVTHFWRIALRVASTEFAVRMLPSTWRHMRRGPGKMAVEVDGERARVLYTSFPYFDDLNYRLLVIGTLRPLLRISTGAEPRISIAGYGTSWLTAEIEFA